MNDTLILFLTIIISAGIGAVIGFKFSQLKGKSEKSTLEERQLQLSNTVNDLRRNIEKIEYEREEIRNEKDLLNNQLSRKNADFDNLKEQNLKRDEELKLQQEQLRRDFKLLANEIFDEKSNSFKKESKENIENILNPLKEKIQTFEKKVEESNIKNYGLHESLKTQLGSLKELNLQMTKEATNLTKALKGDNKAQGNWGELVLERVLEKSGLVKDREYIVQKSMINEEGKRVLPDVIINLPQGKKMIIDSKVSLIAYEQYINSEDKELKKRFLTQHINSIKSHINDLSAKKYEDLYKIESPDFVLMFIPIEPALYLAQNEDKNFFYTAFNKNILLVSPTTLLSTLRTIDTIWSNEKQQQNANDIAKHASSLYAKFKNLLDDLETVGNRIKSTGTAYQSAMKKLTGNQNLIKDIDKLEKLGISPKEKINQKWIDKANLTDENKSLSDNSSQSESRLDL